MSEAFPVFSKAVHRRLRDLSRGELFVVDTQDLYTSYLLAFPEGTNPKFRVNTEHECSCCKRFIRGFGNLVAAGPDGRRATIWGGGEGLPHPYDEVSATLDRLVLQAPIVGVFRTKEAAYGAESTVEMVGDHAHRWDHFHGAVDARHRSTQPDAAKGAAGTGAKTLERALAELEPAAVQTVLDLIEDNALYRGDASKRQVAAFREAQRAYRAAADRSLFVWQNADRELAGFRNSVVGTLVQDLSEGMGLEDAVRRYEAKTAPTNYRRSKPLVTPRMVDSALEALAGLGLEHAVERRMARISDIAVTDVLFVDNEVRGQMKGTLRDALLASARPRAPGVGKATPIGIAEFVSRVVPQAKSMSLVLERRHLSNFMTVTAPQHDDPHRLFKWDNNYAWSYDGDVTDSIKEAVKRAGGDVDARLRVSLAWSNGDDLDLHSHGPDGHVYYASRFGRQGNVQVLDVDMNAGSATNSTNPVENQSWKHPPDGHYRFEVNQFCQRSTSNPGFVVEVECGGTLLTLRHEGALRNRATAVVCEFDVRRQEISNFKAGPDVALGQVSAEKWGVPTQHPARVDTLMLSPNHWEGAGGIGAKHWFFILKGCRNPDPVRGLYVEYLRSELIPHRKVFELLGSKTKCEPTPDQLSGVGFTPARNDEVAVLVNTELSSHAYAVKF